MAKNKFINKITDFKVIFGVQIFASIVLLGLIFKLGILPMKYFIVIAILVALLDVLVYFLMKPSKKKTNQVKNVVGKFVSILLSVALLFGSLKIAQGDSLLGNITNADMQTTRISVVVLKDSGYKSLSDLKGKTIETNKSDDEEKMSEALKALSKEDSSLKTTDNDDYLSMAKHLYDKEIAAIFMNEASYAYIETEYEAFKYETEVIWTYEIHEKVNDISKNVAVTKDTFTMYISGIDTYGKVSTVSRTDVNMIVTVNPKTKQVLMTSIPRDYYVTLANKGKKDKLTHSGLAGIENTVKTAEGFMGVDINYYSRVNFTSLIKIVDALGGIDIQNEKAFTGFEGTHFNQGTVHVSGKQALEFSRERKSLSGGDNDRVHNQQIVLTGIINKMLSPAVIRNYSSVLNAIDGSFETNMSSKEISSLIQMQLGDMASWDIMQTQLTGTGKSMTGGAYMPNNKLYYMVPNESSVKENSDLIKKMQKGEKISVNN